MTSRESFLRKRKYFYQISWKRLVYQLRWISKDRNYVNKAISGNMVKIFSFSEKRVSRCESLGSIYRKSKLCDSGIIVKILNSADVGVNEVIKVQYIEPASTLKELFNLIQVQHFIIWYHLGFWCLFFGIS